MKLPLKLRSFAISTVALASLAATTGCKKDTPASAAAPANAAAPVAPAAPAADPAAPADPSADAGTTEGTLRVENLKVEPVAPGTDSQPAGEGTVDTEPRITGPVALVNDRPIDSALYYEELDKILKRSAKIPPERLARIKENILKRLVEKELITQAVATATIVVPDAHIEKEFEEYKKRFRTEEQFQSYLTHGKVTLDSIKSRIREKKELELLLEKSGKLAVTDAEVEDFYKKNERFYQEREGIKARHILVKVAENASKEEEDKALSRVKEAEAELKKGGDFDKVAEKFSEGPSAPKGGDLGFFGRGQMVKPFEDRAFTMNAGETSAPVRTRFGYHIIQVLEKREARQKTLDEVKPTISESLRNKKFFQERRDLINGLRTSAKIEEKIVIPKSAAGDDAHSGHGAAPTREGRADGSAPAEAPSVVPAAPAEAPAAAPAGDAKPAEAPAAPAGEAKPAEAPAAPAGEAKPAEPAGGAK